MDDQHVQHPVDVDQLDQAAVADLGDQVAYVEARLLAAPDPPCRWCSARTSRSRRARSRSSSSVGSPSARASASRRPLSRSAASDASSSSAA